MTAPIHVLYVGGPVDPVAALRESPDGTFTVCLAASPEDALARLGEGPYDCLVYAGDDPGGERLLNSVHEHASSVPVVAWSAAGDADLAPALYDRTVTDDEDLAAAVTDVVAEARRGTAPAATSATDADIASVTDADSDTAADVDAADSDAADAAAVDSDADTSDDGGTATTEATEVTETAGSAPAADRVRHHELIRENPAFLETVLDSLLDVFFVFTVDRELVEWNTPLEEMTGRSGDDLAGADPLSVLAPEHRDRAFERLAEVLTTGRATAEFDIVSADGERIPLEFTASLITRDGTPRYICGIGRDVTDLREKQAELKRKQTELDRAVEELERSNAELEQFAYVASHDLKEPLRMVTSYLQLLERRYGDELDEDAEEFIDYAVDGAERMRLMMDQLLTYSRIDRKGGEFRTVDSAHVLETVERNLQVAIEESGAEIRAADLPTVTGDRDQLVQLFQNLVSNAIKYNRGTPHVEVRASRRDDIWEFAVADDGVGIPPERIDRVFDPFYGHDSGVDDVDSSGIGLAICQRIVERHGGEIRVESTEGEGSTFYFTLPAEDVTPEELRGHPSAEATPDGTGE